MLRMFDRFTRFHALILWNAEGGSGGGSGAGDAGAPAGGEGEGAGAGDGSPESVLFPNEGDGKPAGEGGEGDAGKQPAANDDGKGEGGDKSDDAKAGEKKDDDKKGGDALDVVPEDGKYNLTMPEGVEVDQELLDAIGPRLKAKGYTHREAQELTDEFIRVQTKQAEDRAKWWGETVQGWADSAKADKEIGGDKFDTSVKNAQRFLSTHGTPELREYLNISGGGNHPELIRVFAKAGAMIREDNPATGGTGGSGKPADAAHVLFPNDVPKG